jgi:hypothetical protein
MKKIILTSLLAMVLFSCEDKDPIVADTFGTQPKVVGFSKSVENAAYFSNVGAVPLNLAVSQIGLAGVGKLTEAPITVNFSVDLANSTATEGTEFSFAGTSRTITIQPGSTLTTIPLLVNTGSLNPTQKTQVVINLTSSSDGVVSFKNKSVKVVFVGCVTNLQGNYSATLPTRTVTVTKIAPNVYECDAFPFFTTKYWWQFSDVCKDLTMTDWRFQGSNALFKTGSGSLPEGVVITPSGNLTFNAVNVTGTSVVNRSFTLIKI